MINESKLDRKIRLLVGLIFLVISMLWLQGALKIVFFIIGIISLITSETGFCLLYNLVGFSSLSKKK